jgi:hypothetical protein
MQDLSLAKLDEVLRAIEAATTVQDIKGTLDMAKAAEVYAKQAKLGQDIELKAAEYIVRAERKLGEMLVAAKAAGQITHNHGGPKKSVIPNGNNTFTLTEAGIDAKLSSRAQKVAAIPKDDFETKVTELKTAGKLTSKMVTRSTRRKKPDTVPKRHDHAAEIIALHDSGATAAEIAEQTGVGQRQVRHIIDREKIERGVEPKIAREDLSLTAQQKLDLAIKQEKARLAAHFQVQVNLQVRADVDEFLKNKIIPKLQWEQDEARRIIESRQGVLDLKSFKKIRDCLHSDRVLDPVLKPKYDEAFRIFMELEKRLLDEKDSPTEFVDFPKTPAEWDELKRQAKEERKRKQKTPGGITPQ